MKEHALSPSLDSPDSPDSPDSIAELPDGFDEALPAPFADVWYIVARSRDLGPKPLARRLYGRDLVLFRDGAGRAAALEDRCLHRHVRLSRGRVDGGALECPYHGWRFDGGGACVGVPCAAPCETLPRRRVPSFAVVEQEGSVWACVGPNPPPAPPRWRRPEEEAAGAAWFEAEIVMATPLRWVLENFVDCGHTGFVHGGLFRGKPTRVVRAVVEDTPTGVRVETFGESDPQSLLGRLFASRGEIMQHTDEIVLPHQARIRYRFGARSALTVSICTPEDAGTTRMFTRVYVDFGPLSRLVAALVYPVTRRIMLQDQVILEDQAAQVRRYGARFGGSSAADVPAAFVARAFDELGRGTFPRTPGRKKEIEYKL